LFGREGDREECGQPCGQREGPTADPPDVRRAVREFQARPLADSARGERRLPSAEAQPEDVPAK